MDIDLLSKMVKELILDQDRVALPGLGSFVAEIVPSTFSDKGYTINPPYRRLFFRSKPDTGDELMSFYASSNNVEMDVAEKIIRDYVSELKAVLHEKKTVVFPGLGRLRATKENNVFFVADETLDIYPAGFGLEPVSLKTHQETQEEVAAAVEGLKSLLDVPTLEPVPEIVEEPVAEAIVKPVPEPKHELPVDEPAAVAEIEPVAGTMAEPIRESIPEPVAAAVPEDMTETVPAVAQMTEPESLPVSESESRQTGHPLVKTLLVLLMAAVILLVAYVAVARLCPEFTDRLLYTPEELEIINS